MEKILVPCDFSDQAIHAFRLAVDIAHASGAEVHVLHVIELPIMHDDVITPLPSFDENLLKELSERAEIKFLELKKESKQDDVLVATKVEFGPIVSIITNYQNENDFNLIVMGTIAMGTHARKGLSHLLKGSVTEDVVNHVDCPIWTYVIKQ